MGNKYLQWKGIIPKGSADSEEQLMTRIAAIKARAGENKAAQFEDVLELVRWHSHFGMGRDEPIVATLVMIGDKWGPLILRLLSYGKFRYSILRELTALFAKDGRISNRIMTLNLRQLERDGFIKRKVWPRVPPRVEYSLTPLGQSLEARIDALRCWGAENFDNILNARQKFDKAKAADYDDELSDEDEFH